MAYNPQMPQMPQQQMPQQPQQQYQNPAANWQQTYQNSQWARKPMMPMQSSQMPQQQMYQQQMPQQFYPQFSQQQLNSFMNFMQNKPLASFMNDPRYQPINNANTSQLNNGSNTFNPGEFKQVDDQVLANKMAASMLRLFR